MSVESVIAANGGYEAHPESYSLRVIAYIMAEHAYYEILTTGQAIPWGQTPPPDSLTYWLIDVPTIHSLGVHRAG